MESDVNKILRVYMSESQSLRDSSVVYREEKNSYIVENDNEL